MTELFESTMDNVSGLEVKGYSDPVKMERTMEIWAKRGDEEYIYKFTGPGVDKFEADADGRCWIENKKLKEAYEKLRAENKDLEAKCKDISDDNALFLETNKKLKESADTWEKEYYRLSIENEKLKKELHSLKQERSKIPMVDDCLKLSKEIEKLTFENAMLKKGNEKLKKGNERLRNENQKLKKDLKEIQEAFPMTANKILYGERELKVENKDTDRVDKVLVDNVNHPSHYETGKFECIEVMQEVFGIGAVINFCKCNAFKYVYRMDRKNGTEDAKKAIWYLNKYLELQDELASELFDDGGEIWHGERHKDK